MTVDHVNKYLLHDAVPAMFDAGRLTMPIFGFVLAYNLSRPDTLARGVYGRTMKRLALFGTLATPAFIGLGGLLAGWWPLNIMFMLLVATGAMYLVERGGAWCLTAAVAVFLVGGSSVEFWWPALTYCMAAWWYCRRPGWAALLLWVAACASLWVINSNLWALAALPLVFAASRVDVRVPRWRYAFYAYYPAHLTALWLIHRWMSA
ncbi:conjugal transfer protein TraX [Burkholderia diffusa]|nr:conjugal transfer protein TraX [Burkholderia diffusa]